MTALATIQPNVLATLDAKTMEALMAGGDCSKLTPEQRNAYYLARCEAAGLDPRASPFQYVRLSGREVLYATKGAADQLAAKHGLRTTIVSQTTDDGIRVVTVRVEAKDGRVTEEIGALPIKGLIGEALSNAMMKCVTKAKRRAVLSVCGLGMMDETEVESIPGAAPVQHQESAPVVEVVQQNVPPAEHATPMHVVALWTRLAKECGEEKAKDKPKTKATLEKAATDLWGTEVPPKHAWTAGDCEELFNIATRIPF